MQEEACRRWEFEVLMGGRAGPGKTDVIVMKPLRYIDYSKFRGVIFRRTFPELEEVVDRTKQWYPAFGGEYKEGKSRWFFPSGATIKLSHMQHENDKYKHQTKEYQYIGFDEGTHFTPTQYLYMFSRARCTDGNIPVQINTGTNPGGVAHQFFKDRFKIGLVPECTTIYDEATGLSRVFIPGTREDNPSLFLNDPDYELRLELLGFARKKLGAAVAPKAIDFEENLPKTRSGKIMRRLLKARELGLPEGDISTLESKEGK